MSKTILNNVNKNKYEGAFDNFKIESSNEQIKNKEYKLNSIDGAVQKTLTREIVENIDFEDRTFVLRNIDFKEYINDEDIKALSNSIYAVGLINPVYIQPKENGKYRVVSGFRRLTAIYSGILSSGDQYTFDGEVILVPIEYDKEDLDSFQVNENTHRENLKPLELAQKILEETKNYTISVAEVGEYYNLSSRQIFRLKAILEYPTPLKNVVNDIGLTLAENINKIIKFKKFTEEKNINEIQELVDELKGKTRDEIIKYFKNLKAEKSNQNIEIKNFKKYHQLTINKSLTSDELKEICDFINNVIASK